jgi:hypothetical protein
MRRADFWLSALEMQMERFPNRPKVQEEALVVLAALEQKYRRPQRGPTESDLFRRVKPHLG